MSGSTAIAHKPYRGATDDWITPPEIVRALGPFDLDPCICTPQPWMHAARGYALAEDGLSQPWDGRVWLNPPYGPATRAWLLRLADHADGIALVQARIETAWFFEAVWERADALLVMRGRPTFYRPDGSKASGNSGGPCVLVAYGSRNVKALASSGLGLLVRIPAPSPSKGSGE